MDPSLTTIPNNLFDSTLNCHLHSNYWMWSIPFNLQSSTLKPSTISTFWRFSILVLVDTEFSIVQYDSGKYAFLKACTKSLGAGCNVCGHVGIRVLTCNGTEQSSLAHVTCPLVQLAIHRTEPAEGMVQRQRHQSWDASTGNCNFLFIFACFEKGSCCVAESGLELSMEPMLVTSL